MKTITINRNAIAGVVVGVIVYFAAVMPLVVGGMNKLVVPQPAEYVAVDTYTYCNAMLQATLDGELGEELRAKAEGFEVEYGGYEGALHKCVQEAKEAKWNGMEIELDRKYL